MTKSEKIINTIAGAGFVYLVGIAIAGAIKRKREQSSTDGIGAIKPKRRIWTEMEEAQKAGIDLSDPTGYKGKEHILARLAQGKLSRSNSSKPDEERYFAQLRRAYKSIAGTRLPHKTSRVYNENGDLILEYHDYQLELLPVTAPEAVRIAAQEAINNPYEYGYWATVAAIATGKKFVWKSKGAHRGIEQLIFGRPAPAERKQRISYLASQEKGGLYPEQWAHQLWEANDSQQDDQEITNGVLDALRSITSVGAARETCISAYLDMYKVEEPEVDIPF